MAKHLVPAVLAVFIPVIASAQPAPEPSPSPEPGPFVENPQPAEAATPEQPAVSATYDGGFELASDDGQFELKLGFKSQVRFTSTRPLDDGSEFLNQFSIVRTRFGADGHFFGEDNRFKLEVAFGDNGSYSFVKDLYVERRLPGVNMFFRAGQWKRPFNRAEIVSDFASEFNERSIENELAGGGRSVGIALHNGYEKSPAPVQWVVGMFNTFNGGSDKPKLSTVCTTDPMTGNVNCDVIGPTTLTPDFGPTFVARLGFNSPDMKGYSEADLEGGPLRYAVAASYKIDLANFSDGAQDSWAANLSHGVELDTMIKAWGYSLEAGGVMMKLPGADPQFGVYAQPGMMVIPKHLQVAGRFAFVTAELTSAGPVDRDEIEARVALNYYFHGHAWKFANDVGFVWLLGDQPSEDKPDLQLRMMLQMAI